MEDDEAGANSVFDEVASVEDDMKSIEKGALATRAARVVVVAPVVSEKGSVQRSWLSG